MGQVTHDVVDAFVADQKDLPPRIGSHRDVPGRALRVEGEVDPARHQHLSGELPQAARQIEQVIALRIHRFVAPASPWRRATSLRIAICERLEPISSCLPELMVHVSKFPLTCINQLVHYQIR